MSLKRRIMARIYLIYLKNAMMEYPDYFMFGLFLITSFSLVSVQDVFNNASNVSRTNPGSLLYFFISAIMDTSWVIQAFLAGFLIRTGIAGAIRAYKKRDTLAKWSPLFKFKY